MNYSETGWVGTLGCTLRFGVPNWDFILHTLKQRKCLFLIRCIIGCEQIVDFWIVVFGNAHLAKVWYVEKHWNAYGDNGWDGEQPAMKPHMPRNSSFNVQ
jgi:hypothetical protein